MTNTNALAKFFRPVGLVYIEDAPAQRMIVRDLETGEWRLIANDSLTTELGRYDSPGTAARAAVGLA